LTCILTASSISVLDETTPTPPIDFEASLEDYFRNADFIEDSAVVWRLNQQAGVIDALRSLFQGSGSVVRLRLWAFLTLVSQSAATLTRDEFDELFRVVRPEALENLLKRFRDAELLAWDETQRRYSITPLAQRLSALLSTLNNDTVDNDDLAGLLGQVVGADQLGTLDANQVQMLQAQLGRLHGDFADAMASGSEFRLREARKRYDRAARLIDKASTFITGIISNAQGNVAMERAARALGQAQSRLLAMASQFNRALQQVDRQRVTLGTTGITSTDVKLWLQTLHATQRLADGALAFGVAPPVLASHELLDVTETEFDRVRPQNSAAEVLPSAQNALEGDLSAIALPQELFDLASLLQRWAEESPNHIDEPATRDAATALLESNGQSARYAQAAYKAQLLPLLGDDQARQLPGATGDLARQPWGVEWQSLLQTIDHPFVEQVSVGQLIRNQHPATVKTDPAHPKGD
jgi:hypothetical protein